MVLSVLLSLCLCYQTLSLVQCPRTARQHSKVASHTHLQSVDTPGDESESFDAVGDEQENLNPNLWLEDDWHSCGSWLRMTLTTDHNTVFIFLTIIMMTGIPGDLEEQVEYQGPHGRHHQPGLQCRQGRTQGRRRCRWSKIQAPSLGQCDPRLLWWHFWRSRGMDRKLLWEMPNISWLQWKQHSNSRFPLIYWTPISHWR